MDSKVLTLQVAGAKDLLGAHTNATLIFMDY